MQHVSRHGTRQDEKTLKEYTNSQISEIIDEYVHNAMHREILKDRYIDGMTYEKIAEKHDLSARYTRTLVYKATQKIINHI